MALIRIDPAALHAAADRHRKVYNTVEEVAARMDSMASQLNSVWDGGASEQAISELKEIRASVKRIAAGNEESAGFLDGVAQAFEALDAGNGGISAIRMVVKGIADLACPRPIIALILGLRGVLRIEPDGVREVAAQGRSVADILMSTCDELRSSTDALMANWEGNSARKFQAETEDMIQAFLRVAEAMNEYSDSLISAANRYEELDNSL